MTDSCARNMEDDLSELRFLSVKAAVVSGDGQGAEFVGTARDRISYLARVESCYARFLSDHRRLTEAEEAAARALRLTGREGTGAAVWDIRIPALPAPLLLEARRLLAQRA